jgi:hypothetical protein
MANPKADAREMRIERRLHMQRSGDKTCLLPYDAFRLRLGKTAVRKVDHDIFLPRSARPKLDAFPF